MAFRKLNLIWFNIIKVGISPRILMKTSSIEFNKILPKGRALRIGHRERGASVICAWKENA
jgi:hypothetical protein